jgi:hypothetical protein
MARRIKLDHSYVIYDSWRPNRKVIRKAVRGTIVQGLGKLSVVFEPDIITISRAIPRLGLAVGDTIFRYTAEGESFADFWIKGRWYESLDGSFITDLNESAVQKNAVPKRRRSDEMNGGRTCARETVESAGSTKISFSSSILWVIKA